MFLLLHLDSDELSSGLTNLDLKSFLDGLLEMFHGTLLTDCDARAKGIGGDTLQRPSAKSGFLGLFAVNFLVEIGLSSAQLKGDSTWSL